MEVDVDVDVDETDVDDEVGDVAVVSDVVDDVDGTDDAVPEPLEHAASNTNAKSCTPMETFLTVLGVTAALVALAWALRFRPGRIAPDGSWFDCEYQIVELRGPNEQGARWHPGRAEVVGREVLVRVGPARRMAALGEPLPVMRKLDSTRRRQSVFLLGGIGQAVTISVLRGSKGEQRLEALVER